MLNSLSGKFKCNLCDYCYIYVWHIFTVSHGKKLFSLESAPLFINCLSFKFEFKLHDYCRIPILFFFVSRGKKCFQIFAVKNFLIRIAAFIFICLSCKCEFELCDYCRIYVYHNFLFLLVKTVLVGIIAYIVYSIY